MENFEKIKRKGVRGHYKWKFRYPDFLPRCNGKHSYRTWEEAEKLRNKQEERSGIPLYTYQCPYYYSVEVIHWHLTHKPRHK